MKHLLSIAAVACAFACNAATFFDLKPGLNDIQSCGEIVAVEANTLSASQVVTASVVTAVSEYTNTYAAVTSRHLRYDFTITNYDGNATIATNCLDSFSYAPWATNVSWISSIVTNTTPWTTNWTHRNTRIISPVTTKYTNITENVVSGTALKATYSHETAIGNGSASSHYLKITPANTVHFIGGKIKCSCADGDSVRILVK